ncbi:MAG: hypothetical protein GY950_15975 [bacterium]|nr:hypothetical protein [bacterium]
MKKSLVLIIVVIVAFMAATLPVFGTAADDYKVIKNAVKGKKGGTPTWFKLTVYDKKAKKDKVTIKVPFALLEVFSECGKKMDIKDDCDVDFKKIFSILKKHGNTTLIEIDGEDELVKIWVE